LDYLNWLKNWLHLSSLCNYKWYIRK